MRAVDAILARQSPAAQCKAQASAQSETFCSRSLWMFEAVDAILTRQHPAAKTKHKLAHNLYRQKVVLLQQIKPVMMRSVGSRYPFADGQTYIFCC